MLFILVLFFLELFLLFYLSSLLTKSLSFFFFRLTKNKTLTIQLLALIFLPGVIVHELAHLIVAGVLFVRTGEIEFLPKLRDSPSGEGELKLGSVEIAKTDPVRRAVIGFAPIFAGLTIIVTTFYYLGTDSSIASDFWKMAIIVYVFFQIGNTMFSSKKDLEGTLELLLTIGVVMALFYIIGVRLDFSFVQSFGFFDLEGFLRKLNLFLLAPIAIDIFIILILRIFRGILKS